MKNQLSNRSIISIDDFSKNDVKLIFKRADTLKEILKRRGSNLRLRGKVLALLFYEPSSRTFASFAAAMQYLGGGLIPLHSMNYSSVAKGESFEDTIKTFSHLSDAIVLRSSEKGLAKRAAEISDVPVINAGDGTSEHPTQALLDFYTIKNHFNNISKIKVGLVGDLKNGRTVHSLAKLLLKSGAKNFFWISPKALKMPAGIVQQALAHKTQIHETESLTRNISQLDVLYMTRIQKERFVNITEYQKYKGSYIVDKNMMEKAKRKMILMHPLPRIGEIGVEVDKDYRAVYFKEQIPNGLYVRLAILDLILNQ